MFRFTNIVARKIIFKLICGILPAKNHSLYISPRLLTVGGKPPETISYKSKSNQSTYNIESKNILENIRRIFNDPNFDKNKLWKYLTDSSVKLNIVHVAFILSQIVKKRIDISRTPEKIIFFTEIFEKSQDNLNARSVGNVCNGLRLMTCNNAKVRRLLRAITVKVISHL